MSLQKSQNSTVKNYFNCFVSQNINQKRIPVLKSQSPDPLKKSNSVRKIYGENGRCQVMIKSESKDKFNTSRNQSLGRHGR